MTSGCADELTRESLGPERADIVGLLQLLLSARVSLELHGSDPVCMRIMSDCIADFEQRYGLSTADVANGIMWSEQSTPALIRLLVYAQAEATDTLNDPLCAERLEMCAARLMQNVLSFSRAS